MIQFAVVGLGHIGKRHISVIQQNPNAELVAVCDITKDCEYSVPYFNSLEKLFASKIDIDVVNICTPNGLHAEQAIQALEHNCHVIIEKPIALTKTDTEKIYKKAREVSKQVFCVMQNRYSPPAQLLKHLVSENILGNIFMVQVNCFWNRDERYYQQGSWHGTKQLDGGTLFTQFSHFVDTLYWLFGDITNIHSKFSNFSHQSTIDFEDSGTITFDFVNGGTGMFSYSTAVWNKNMESSIIIVGKYGSIKVSGQYMDTIEYCEIKNFFLPEIKPSIQTNHSLLLENCIKKIHNQNVDVPTIEDGIRVVDIIERMYQS